MTTQLLSLLQSEFHENIQTIKNLVPREVSFPVVANKIKVAIGMRRSGKTYFMYQSIQERLKQGTPITCILYLNFEDDRLLPLTSLTLAALLEAFYELYPENHDLPCYFYLDEIQNVPGWEQVIRRFHDTKKVEIYLTGSSAKLLSKEIATTLRGRAITTEIWPYSFNEYQLANKIKINRTSHSKKTYDQMKKIFGAYLSDGGFPEVTEYSQELRQRALQDYVDIVIYRDIIERHAITQPTVIKYLIATMLHNIAKPFSINKFYNDIKSQGYQITKDSLYEYVQYIEDAYMQFSVPLYSQSIRQAQVNPKKIYAVDTGLVHAFTLEMDINYGYLFENIVYLDLRRQGYIVNYYLTQDRTEIDFLVQNKKGGKYLLQITWEMINDNTRTREERALAMAKQELKIDGRIMTLETYLREGIQLPI